MTTPDALNLIQSSALSHAISKSNHLLIAGFQVFHVMGFVLLLAALVLISLRLLGLVLTQQTVPEVASQALRLVWSGLALAVGSGVLMFIGSPKHYFYNPAFDVKMVLLLVAVLVQALLFRKVANSDHPSPWLARTTVAVSLVFWFAVSMAGRAIGFV
jgi:cytochrome bd-type quinol oxidase subunit 2